ncbi:tumor necrosis factor alpha-induced protein 2-like [Xenentodon cancila]
MLAKRVVYRQVLAGPASPSQSQPVPASPSQSQPAPVSPSQSQPVPASPSQSQPAPVSPSQSQPVPASPSQSQPAPASPSQPQLVPASPSQSQPAPASPSQSQPAPASPSQSQPVPASPSQSQPAPASPSQSQQVPASPSKSQPAPANPSQPQPVPASPSQSQPVPASPSQSQQVPASPSQPQPAPANPSQPQPAPASPSQSQPVPARPSQSQPAPASPSQSQPVPASPSQSQQVPASPSKSQPVPASPSQSQPAPASPSQSQPVPASPSQSQPAPASPSQSQPVPASPSQSQPAPASVRNFTFEQLLEENLFSEASLQLIDRENQLLLETTEEKKTKDLHQLDEDHKALEKVVFQSLSQSLSLRADEASDEAAVSALTTVLASAVKAIYQEEEHDLQRKLKKNRSLRNWKNLHDSVLLSLVETRLENPVARLPGQAEPSSVQFDIQAMGKQLKEDLLFVVRALKDCYPPEANICTLYAALYHQTFSTRLREIADFVLEDGDCTFVLRWVNEYYPGILKTPELAGEIDSAEFGKLLPEESLKVLEEQYLQKQESELSTYIYRVLEEDMKKWDEGEEPTRYDGCYVSPLAYDVIQFVNGMVMAAETVVGSRDKAQMLTCQLIDLMQRFRLFQENIMKQNRWNSRAHVKANLGCIEQFRDVLHRKTHLFPEDVWKNCLCILTDMKQSAHSYLLSPVHKLLKPQYRKLGTKNWLKKNLFEHLLCSIEKAAQELQGSCLPSHQFQELLGQFHREVTEEYVRRLLRGEVKLKDREQQQAAYATVTDNAERLHRLFTELGSKEEWLKEILTKMAEVLTLQDIPAIQMQVVSLGFAYPDLSEKHVSALLKLKTNVSKAERKTIKATLSDTLREAARDADAPAFFSNVDVR